jgi:hypothetical protein
MRDDGRVFMSTTELDGRYTLRLVPLSFRTHLEQVDLALELLEGFAARERDRSSG